MRKAILIGVCSFIFSSLFGGVIYVDKNANGANNGTSWSNAFTNLGTAINSANAGDEIRITVGVYQYNNQSYTINKNITITGGFGGFESGSTPTYSIENLDVNDSNSSTMINGQGNEAFLTIDGTTANGSITSSTIIQNIFFASNGSKHFGIEVKGDNTNQTASPIIRDCVFSSFKRSCIYINGQNGNIAPLISNNIFRSNGWNNAGTEAMNGAAIHIDADNSNSQVSINNSEFTSNRVLYNGGAIASNGCDLLSISHCNFRDNQITDADGAGGALNITNSDNFVVTNTTFNENKTQNVGGVIYLQGETDFSDEASFLDCTFFDNESTGFGGVFYNFYVNLIINRCKFYNNSAPSGGGVLVQAHKGGNINNSVFSGNNGGSAGNAVFSFYDENDGSDPSPYSLNFSNCSFNQNKNDSNGGPTIYANHIGNGTTNNFNNCIFWENGTSEIQAVTNATATLNHSILDDGIINGVVQLPTNVSGTDNLDMNPMFIDDSLRIDCMSPAVDRGTSVSVGTTDLAGNNRTASPFLLGGYIDMGAFEVQSMTGGVDIDFDGLANECDNCENNPNPAINFDGTNDYMNSVIDEFGSGNQVHTIEAWVYIDELPSFRSWPLHLGQYDFGAHHWLVEADGDFVVGEFSGQQTVVTAGVNLQEWTHIATVFDGSLLFTYKNGVLQNTILADFNFTNKDLHLGKKRVTENDFNGSIDEVRIWNVARTPQEIAANSYRELRGDETGLIAYYDFNEGIPNESNTSLSTIPDRSGNSNTGTLNNLTKTGMSSNWVIGAPIMHRDLDGNGYGDICECDPLTAGTPCDDLDANTYNDVLDAACKCAGVPFSDGCVSGDTEQFGVEGDLNVSFTTINALSCTGGELTGEAHITYKQYLKDDWFVFEGLACNEDTPILIRRPKRLRDNAATSRSNYDYCFLETWEIENATCVTDILTISVYVYRDEVINNNLTLNQSTIPQNLYLAENQITSQGSITTNDTVDFVAGTAIILSPGFIANSGSTFSAKIKTPPACNAQRVSPIIPTVPIGEQKELVELPSLSVYPNPSSIEMTINYQLPEPSKINLALYSLNGQLLKVISNKNIESRGKYSSKLAIENYPKGIYFVQFQTEQTQVIKKIVIQ